MLPTCIACIYYILSSLKIITARVRGEVMFSYCLCVCLSVCLCVCLSVCVSVWAMTFECLDIETSFLVWWYILTISRSSLDTKFVCYDQLIVLMLSLRSRSSHGQGHFKITVILRSRSFWNQMAMYFDFYPEAGGWLSSECSSYLFRT